MEKIKKDYNAKVVALTIVMLFLFINIAYSLDISCLRVPLKFGSLGQLSAERQLRDFVGDFPTFNTFKAIINSLGAFDNGFAVSELSQKYKDDRIGYIPFTLNESGIRFFKELFDIESIDSDAYLLVYNDEEEAGVKNFPYGLLLKDSKIEAHSFNLTEFFLEQDAIHFRYDISAHQLSVTDLLPDYNEWPTKQIKLNRLRDVIHDETGTDISFEMLAIDRKDIFGFWDQYSRDFQEVVCENANLIKDMNVVEVGIGTGVNILHALKFGAKSVVGTDISYLYVLLSRWQVQFAQDTGQVPILPKGSVRILHQSGFPKGISGDLYMINMPCIISGSRKKIQDKILGELKGNSLFISEEAFVALFKELKRRLSSPNVLALCRILPGFPDRSKFFPEPRQETIDRLGGFYDHDYGVAIARATEFLEKQSDKIRIIPSDYYRDIFLLRSSRISNRFINPKTVDKSL